MRTACHDLISLPVRLSVYLSVYVILVVFTGCESCTRLISTNPGSMEGGEYGLTRGTWVFAWHLDAVVVAGLLWLSFVCFAWSGFFSRVMSMSLHFQIRTSRAVSVDSVKGLRQPAHLPIENPRPPIPTKCTV